MCSQKTILRSLLRFIQDKIHLKMQIKREKILIRAKEKRDLFKEQLFYGKTTAFKIFKVEISTTENTLSNRKLEAKHRSIRSTSLGNKRGKPDIFTEYESSL